MTDFEHFGPYRVEEKLGKGGMGTVYRGVHAKTGQRVAIKVLASQMSEQPRFRRRFANEIETLKKLTHPNIVRLIGYGEEEGMLFYSMELVEGPSLLEHLRKVKRLDWDTTIGWAMEICSALKHAHDFGVIHRDLKPANLLIEPEGSIKLTDFGIAKLFGADEHTAAGSVLGTADYMAPEQASGTQVTPRTDLYALGSLIYACLVGRPPFGGRNLTQVIHGLKHESPAPLDLVLPEVPPELAELVHELLEKDPADRPPTALVVSKRLAAMRAGLRGRGQQTRVDSASPTLSETLESLVQERLPREGDAEGVANVADQATASERDSDQVTGQVGAAAHTVASAVGASEPRGEEGTDPPIRTHFETVPDSPLERTAWQGAEEPHGSTAQWWSLVSLVALLIGVLGVIIWWLRGPTADQLLTEIEAYRTAGQETQLEDAMVRFRRQFPDHPRSDAFAKELTNDAASQMLKRLRRRALVRGGVENLGAAEMGWVTAMESRHTNPAVAARRLSAWLELFGDPQAREALETEASLGQLVELAKETLHGLNEGDGPPADPRTEQLRSVIEWGEANLEGEALQRFFDSAHALYGEHDWAEPVLSGLPSR